MLAEFRRRRLTRKLYNETLQILLTGSRLCFVGCPEKFSKRRIKDFLEKRGHLFFFSEQQASLFLTSNNKQKFPKALFFWGLKECPKLGKYASLTMILIDTPGLRNKAYVDLNFVKESDCYKFFSYILYVIVRLSTKRGL